MSVTEAGEAAGLDKRTDRKWGATLGVAVLILILFMAMAVFLINWADDPGTTDSIWGRYLYVFGVVQAVAFTAVGWVFGREVNRTAVDQASTDAAKSKATAEAATSAATASAVEAATNKAKGEALRDAVVASADAAPAPPTIDGIGGAAAAVGDSQLASLRAMAATLFPPS